MANFLILFLSLSAPKLILSRYSLDLPAVEFGLQLMVFSILQMSWEIIRRRQVTGRNSKLDTVFPPWLRLSGYLLMFLSYPFALLLFKKYSTLNELEDGSLMFNLFVCVGFGFFILWGSTGAIHHFWRNKKIES